MTARFVFLGAVLWGMSQAATKLPEEYAVLTRRNIFDASRVPYRPRQVNTKPVNPVTVEPRTDRIRLCGIWIQDHQAMALFERNDGEPPRLRIGDRIGTWTIQKIFPAYVGLVNSEGQTLRWYPGQSLERRGDNPWRLGTRSAPLAAPDSPMSTAYQPVEPMKTAAPATGEKQDSTKTSPGDILQRLKERRLRDIKK